MRTWLRDQWYQIVDWRESLKLAKEAIKYGHFSFWWGYSTPGVWVTWYDGPHFTINLVLFSLYWGHE